MTDAVSEKIKEFLGQVTGHMQIECTIAVTLPEDSTAPLSVDIHASKDTKLLIGKNGQNLQALEHVVRTVLARSFPTHRSLVIDVNGYRKEKTQELLEVVRQAASRVRDTRKPEALEPMTSYERRFVHTELASWSDLTTESIGQDPQRRVIIKLL